MHLFYIPSVSGDTCKLGEEESKHCVRVLRLKENDIVEITDGKGNLFKATIENANPKSCVLRVGAHNFEPLPTWELVIAVAPTKNLVRMEWLIEKLTEIGITRFIPISCHRSERRQLKTERLRKIAIEAMKQSGRLYLPDITDIITLSDLLQRSKDNSFQKLICTCSFKNSVSLNSINSQDNKVLTLIGPEGDFTTEEIESAIACGFKPVTLGKYVLRTETAALVAAAGINLFCR